MPNSANTNGSPVGALSNDFINQLLASGRDRNFYGPMIVAFEALEVNGVDATEHFPALAAKMSGGMKAQSIVMGFRNAAEKANVDWLVVKALEVDGVTHVFLINTNLVTIEA